MNSSSIIVSSFIVLNSLCFKYLFLFLIVIACESFEKVLQTLSIARAELNEILSAFELLDSESLFLSTRHLKATNPLETSAPFYVLVETSGSNSTHDEAKLNSFLKTIMEAGIVIDGTVSTDPSKMGASN